VKSCPDTKPCGNEFFGPAAAGNVVQQFKNKVLEGTPEEEGGK
jgi:hypothetical protein